jgi:hypothetical protein
VFEIADTLLAPRGAKCVFLRTQGRSWFVVDWMAISDATHRAKGVVRFCVSVTLAQTNTR